MASPVAELVRDYLDKTKNTYEVGHPNYFARLALDEALQAYLEGNYGIGAVAVVVDEHEVKEYRARNRMITGQGIIDHAEIRAILRYAAASPPDTQVARDHNAHTRALPPGLSVYGSLEPCPMCTTAIINAGATMSISTVADGVLIRRGEYLISDGGANAIGDKAHVQPLVWQEVVARRGAVFQLLETEDNELRALSESIFLDTREEIDKLLADRSGEAASRSWKAFPPER